VGTDQFGIYYRRRRVQRTVHERALAILAAVRSANRIECGRSLSSAGVTLCDSRRCIFANRVGSGSELSAPSLCGANSGSFGQPHYRLLRSSQDHVNSLLRSFWRRSSARRCRQSTRSSLPADHRPAVGCSLAMEALLRWQHPTRGMLYGREFAPILERSSEHPRVVAWQLDRALRTRQAWGDRDLPVSVNLAVRSLLDRRFPDQVFAILDRTGVSAGQLMLEIDETAMLAQLSLVDEVLTNLRTQGVQIAIDGWGPAPVRCSVCFVCPLHILRSTVISSDRCS
jgi:hypothetical protein